MGSEGARERGKAPGLRRQRVAVARLRSRQRRDPEGQRGLCDAGKPAPPAGPAPRGAPHRPAGLSLLD